MTEEEAVMAVVEELRAQIRAGSPHDTGNFGLRHAAAKLLEARRRITDLEMSMCAWCMERVNEKTAPRQFKVGDRVRDQQKRIVTIDGVNPSSNEEFPYRYEADGITWYARADVLEPVELHDDLVPRKDPHI